jgi:hypothetical protein
LLRGRRAQCIAEDGPTSLTAYNLKLKGRLMTEAGSLDRIMEKEVPRHRSRGCAG